jgi:hypothetical protein
MGGMSLLFAACIFLGHAGAAISQSEQWQILETAESGRPVIVSVPKQLPNSTTREDFPWVTSIEWRYPIRERGMPADALLDEMYKLESELERGVASKNLCRLVITRTGNGLREWTYYAKDRKVAEVDIANIVKSFPDTVRISVRREPEWTTLREVLSNIQDRPK